MAHQMDSKAVFQKTLLELDLVMGLQKTHKLINIRFLGLVQGSEFGDLEKVFGPMGRLRREVEAHRGGVFSRHDLRYDVRARGGRHEGI